MNSETGKIILSITLITLGTLLGLRAVLSLLFSKEKLKRFHKVLRIVLTVVFILGSFACIALSIAREMDPWSFRFWTFVFGNEFVCYSVISMAYLTTFYALAKKNKLSLKIALSAVGAVLLTVEVFFVNNILRTVQLGRILGFRDFSFREEFWPIVKHDLGYSLGLGMFRYVLVFLLQLTALVIVSVLSDPKVRAALRQKADNTKRKLFTRS